MGLPEASSASASRSLRMICSGEWRMRFIGSPPALKGENDSHIGWTSLRGAGHQGNGVSVVVGGRESRPQGEGRQVTSTSKAEEVREMRDAETVLGIIQDRGKR